MTWGPGALAAALAAVLAAATWFRFPQQAGVAADTRLAPIDRLFYINLDASKDRRQMMERQLERRIVGKDIPFERFSAVHGRVMLDPAINAGEHIRQYVATRGMSTDGDNIKKRGLVTGIFMSHTKLWKQIAERHAHGVYMIMEDDVMFQMGWQKWIGEAIRALDAAAVAWDMLKLFNIAHHDPAVWTKDHAEIRCAEPDSQGKIHCGAPRDRVLRNITEVCVENMKRKRECERLVRLGPAGSDGRNLGLQGYLIRHGAESNLKKMLGVVERGELRHLDELINLHLDSIDVMFLTDSSGYKVIRAGTTIVTSENGKTQREDKGVSFGRTD